MAKKVKENESVFVDVDTNGDVVSVTNVAKDIDSHCGIDAVVEAINEVPKKSSVKKSSKKVADIALETQISDLEKALEKAKSAIEIASADNERLADELGVNVAENKSLRKELNKLRQDYKKLQGDNRANNELVSELHNQLTRKDVQFKELKSTVSRLQTKVKQYADESLDKDEKILHLEEVNAKLSDELQDLTTMNFFQRIKFLFVTGKGNKS